MNNDNRGPVKDYERFYSYIKKEIEDLIAIKEITLKPSVYIQQTGIDPNADYRMIQVDEKGYVLLSDQSIEKIVYNLVKAFNGM